MSGPQPYTQTILLDANRLSSEEFSASNLAQTDTADEVPNLKIGLKMFKRGSVSLRLVFVKALAMTALCEGSRSR